MFDIVDHYNNTSALLEAFSKTKLRSLTLAPEHQYSFLHQPCKTFFIRSSVLLDRRDLLRFQFHLDKFQYPNLTLKNALRLLYGVSRNKFRHICSSKVEGVANFRQWHQDKIVVGSKDHDEVSCPHNILDDVYKLADILFANRKGLFEKNAWMIASWVCHLKYIEINFSHDLGESYREKINYLYNDLALLIRNLVRFPEKIHATEVNQIYGALMKFALLFDGEPDFLFGSKKDQLVLVELISAAPTKDACELFNKIASLTILNSKLLLEKSKTALLHESLMLEFDALRRPDGGFSFFPGYSQNNYLGRSFEQEKGVPDLHGTAMCLWGLSWLTAGLEVSTALKDIYRGTKN